MLIYHPRRRCCLIFVLIFGSFVSLYNSNYIKKYCLTDEHRIYTSLLIELPRLERLIRAKQMNLSSIQNQLLKNEKTLSKYTWHLNRLIKTMNYNKEEQKRIYHFNSFDLDLERNTNNNQTKFLIYFHLIDNSDSIDYDSLKKFHSKISLINSPYITWNRSEAYLHVIYLPIRSMNKTICYKDLIDRNYFVIYEFMNPFDEEIDEKCFGKNFLHVKFFTRLISNQTLVNNDRWRLKDEQQTGIGIIYLNTNATIAAREYDRLKTKYQIVTECSDPFCYQTILNKNFSIISIICSSTYSISIQHDFYELFFYLLSQQIHLILSTCQKYLPYSKVIDWSHPTSSLPWLYTIYFQTFERRLHTLIAYLRTDFRLSTLPNESNFSEMKNELIKEKNFYYLIHSRSLNFTQMSIGLMDKISFQSDKKPSIQFEATFYDQWNRLYQPFYRSKTLTNPFETTPSTTEKYTIIILTHKKRFYQLNRLLLHLNGLINLHRIVVLFNQVDQIDDSKKENLSLKDFLGDYYIYLPSIHVEIIYVFTLTNNLNNRFLPWNQFIQTDCILSLDDDSFLRHDEIEYAFRIWKENRSRLIGFISRSHKPDTLEYDASPSCSYSMILTGAAFFHHWYLDYYTNIMSEQIRQYVKLNMNCEDIAMNFLISYLTKQSSIKIGSRETFHCYKCEESLSNKIDHYNKRTECIKYFSNIYRLIPLHYSVYHVDHLLNITSCFL